MYYLNSFNQNTCAPHPDIMATTESQLSENLNISSRCVNQPLDKTDQKIIFLAFDFNSVDYKIKCMVPCCNCICCVLLAVTNVSSMPTPLDFYFVVLGEERSFHNKYRSSRRIARSHFGCCWPHKGTWRSTETNNTRSSHTSGKVHWGWRWDFQTFIVNCNRFVF